MYLSHDLSLLSSFSLAEPGFGGPFKEAGGLCQRSRCG